MPKHSPNAIKLSLVRLERVLLKDLIEVKALRSISIGLYIPSLLTSLDIDKREEEHLVECKRFMAALMADRRLRKLEVYAAEPSFGQRALLWHSSKKQPVLRMRFSVQSGQLERVDK